MNPKSSFGAVRAILMRDWDPIGINDVPAAQDEYDRYIDQVLRLFERGASVTALSDRLLEIETADMGLRGDRGRALRVAEQLFALRSRA
jgi:hypothetical protein